MYRKILAATSNKGKLREFAQILEPMGFELVTPKDIGCSISPEETGTTFRENSLIKSRAFMEATGLPALADDSGLTVDCLNGAPGVYSARYGGEDTPYPEKIALLHKEMAQSNNPENTRAAFVTEISLVFPDGRELCARGEVWGNIAPEIRGDGGFGYDPVFIPEGYDKTFGELPQELKNQISHRGKALVALAKMLEKEDI